MAGCPAHRVPRRVVERVLGSVVLGDGGCLLSTYAASDRGYAKVSWREGGVPFTELAHRVAWAEANGPIPDGMTVHHLCFQRKCVNSRHLGLLERFENARRQGGADWPVGTCRNGHPNTELVAIGGQRRCLPCYRAKTARATARRRAQKEAGRC